MQCSKTIGCKVVRQHGGGDYVSRNIVLLSDGTGNSAAKVWRTNVWRTFEALDLSGNDQVAFYDDGVGTSTFKPWAILGGAFGFGLKRNVIDIYKFACRNYQSDSDDIYGFGFSRGAFTIRVVIGLILNQGLVSAGSEAELDNKAIAAYRNYRGERYHTLWPWHPEDWFRAIRNALLPITYDKRDNRQVKHIRFVGVWDTVAAYGLPMDEMTRGVSRWIMPLELPTHTLDRERVLRACQALRSTKSAPRFILSCGTKKSFRPRSSIRTRSGTSLTSKSARSGSPVSIPMSAAVTRMTRWPIFRWSGCSTKRNAVV